MKPTTKPPRKPSSAGGSRAVRSTKPSPAPPSRSPTPKSGYPPCPWLKAAINKNGECRKAFTVFYCDSSCGESRTSSGGDTRIWLQPDRCHRTHGALLIDIRRITGDAHGADHLAALITDQHTTRCRHQLTVCQVVNRADKCRTLLCVCRNQARALAQCQRAPGLADGNLRA